MVVTSYTIRGLLSARPCAKEGLTCICVLILPVVIFLFSRQETEPQRPRGVDWGQNQRWKSRGFELGLLRSKSDSLNDYVILDAVPGF